MGKAGDEAIIAIMGKHAPGPPKKAGPVPAKKPVLEMEVEDEDEATEGDDDRDMLVADLQSALDSKDADALYDAIFAVASKCMMDKE